MFRTNWLRKMAEGRAAIAALYLVMRSWLPMLERDVPNFDGSSFGDNPSVPDDVLEDAGRLNATTADFEKNMGQALPYAAELNESISAAVARAAKEWAEAEAADEKYQALQSSVRELSEMVAADLVAFRRTLLAVFGRNDRDYQRLRVKRAHIADEYDDDNAPDSPLMGGSDEPVADEPVADEPEAPAADEPAAPAADEPATPAP